MNIVIMGAPSCGKGIQAKLIEKKFGLEHISTGQILRDFIAKNNKESAKIKKIMSRGEFIVDSLMCKIVSLKLDEINDKGFILDGFPRTEKQTKFLLKHYSPDVVLYLHTDKDNALERCENRVVCPVCKKSYDKRLVNNLVCPDDGEILITREDDKPDVYLKRYKIFEKETKPILDMFKRYGKLEVIDNNGDIESTFNEISKILVNMR